MFKSGVPETKSPDFKALFPKAQNGLMTAVVGKGLCHQYTGS